MNKIEKVNYDKLVNDISSDNLSDQEIVEMWQAPALHKIQEGLSKFKLEQFLISKGVSKDYAPEGVTWLLAKAGIDNPRDKKITLGGLFTEICQSLLSRFKFKD